MRFAALAWSGHQHIWMAATNKTLPALVLRSLEKPQTVVHDVRFAICCLMEGIWCALSGTRKGKSRLFLFAVIFPSGNSHGKESRSHVSRQVIWPQLANSAESQPASCRTCFHLCSRGGRLARLTRFWPQDRSDCRTFDFALFYLPVRRFQDQKSTCRYEQEFSYGT